LLRANADRQADAAVAEKVAHARATQIKRCHKLNATMTNADIKCHSHITTEAEQLLNTAAQRVQLSARAYMRTVKVARTIADLDQSVKVTAAHISEALTYRSLRTTI
jgi:magnesium chelatase family protein